MGSSKESMASTSPPSKRLRVWLIVVTVLAVIGIVGAIPSVLFGTYMAAFAADDPSATVDAVWQFMLAVWAMGAVYVALLFTGVVGAWIAYRKQRSRLAFGLSLLAAVPIFLILAVIVVIVVVSYVWTGMIMRSVMPGFTLIAVQI